MIKAIKLVSEEKKSYRIPLTNSKLRVIFSVQTKQHEGTDENENH